MYKLKWTLIGILFAIFNGSTSAFGGVYPLKEENGIGIDVVTVTYGVDSTNGNVTMDIKEDYWGGSENFLWLIPVPSDSKPQVELDFNEHFVTPVAPVIFDLPPNYCADLYDPLYSGGDGGDDPNRGYPQHGQVDILEGGEIINWLSASEYNIPQTTLAAVQMYADQGMTFVAVPMSQEVRATHGSLSLRIVYQSGRILLPLGILQAEADSFDLRVNILADSRYIAKNYEDVIVDLNDLRISHAIASGITRAITTGASLRYFAERSNYLNLRNLAFADANYKGFITQLAAPTERLILEMGDDTPEEGFYLRGDTQNRNWMTETLGEYDYLTRFDGVIRAEDGTILPDAEFVPVPQIPDVTNILDATSAEPLAVWGCSTRTIANNGYDDLLPYLPPGRTQLVNRLLPLKFVAHPEGWQLSNLNYNNRQLIVVAPEPIDATVVDAYLSGQAAPPMLFVHYNEGYAPGDSSCGSRFASDLKQPQYFRCIADMWPGVGGSSGTVIGILTSDTDFAAHESMYRAMVDYPFTYQYMLHPELRNSLVLSPTDTPSIAMFFPPLAIGYPEGWRESMPETQHLFIMPETFRDADNAPSVRAYPASEIAEPAVWDRAAKNIDVRNQVADWLVAHFGVDKQTFMETYLASCEINTPLAGFQRDGRTGYVAYLVRYDEPFILEISAPDTLYTDYQQDIENIRDSVITQFGCG